MSNEEFRQQIYGNLNLKETDELLSIWQTNNRAFWSDEAFEVIKKILQERGAELPEQDEPIYEIKKETGDEETVDRNGLEEWEAKALDDESQPEFYDTLEVINLKDNINKTAKAVIVLYILVGIMIFQSVSSMVSAYFPHADWNFRPLVYFIATILTVLTTAVDIAIVYFPLKALSHILRILMEMEFRSRKGT